MPLPLRLTNPRIKYCAIPYATTVTVKTPIPHAEAMLVTVVAELNETSTIKTTIRIETTIENLLFERCPYGND